MRYTLLVLFASLFGLVPGAFASAGEIKAESAIEAISETQITVATVTFQLNGGTEYEGLHEELLTNADFAVGDYVEVKGLLIDGVLIAREVEKSTQTSDDDSSSGDDDDDDSSSDDDDDDDSSSSDDDDDDSLLGDDDDDSSSDDDDDSSQGKGKNKGNSSNGASTIDLQEKAKPAGLDLKIRRNAKLNKKGRGKDQLDIKLKVVLPSTLPAIADGAGAAAADLRIIFARDGVDFATCSFEYTGLDDSQNVLDPLRAEYRVRLKERYKSSGNVLRRKNGLCDTDASASGDQEGIAGLRKGDSYRVIEVTPTSDNEFISGAL